MAEGIVVFWGTREDTDRKTGLSYHAMMKRWAESFGHAYHSMARGGDLFNALTTIKNCSFVWIWNGRQNASGLVAEACQRRGIPHCFLEWGMLPQNRTFFVDPKGFCGNSILNESLHWVSPEDYEQLLATREKLQQVYPVADDGYVLVPLQIHNDTQVIYNSSVHHMGEVIETVERMYPDDTKIVFRPHPRGGIQEYPKMREASEISKRGTFLEAAARASVVVGLTSTCLFEAAVLGKKVVALGDHPYRTHSIRSHELLTAGALSLRLHREQGDLRAITDRFGLHPLGSNF